MPEKITFRGKTQEEMSGMSNAAYFPLIKSKMRRSIKRNGVSYQKLLEKIEKRRKLNNTKPIRTHVREAVILPSWLGIRFEVHNGKEFLPVYISMNMLGHRLGEYSHTTKHVQHSAPGIRATRGSKFLAVK
jgi:small subunit ribosomal protein S19